MKRFTSLLLPIDGSPEAAKGAGCALWLAEALGATLHVLHAAAQPLPAREALEQLHVPGVRHARVVLHQLPEHAAAAVLDAVTLHSVGLVVMSARGESASEGLRLSDCLGTVAQAVIERSPVPVLLLPLRYRETLPWAAMLAATTGETASGLALEAATQLAAALNLKVTVVHADNGPSSARGMPLGNYADAAHHEYPRRIQQMVERGLAGCTHEECGCVDRVLLRRGNPAAVLLEQAADHAANVIALGWHGELCTGRAPVLKSLLEESECALLLVRKAESSSARLKVGEQIHD